MPEEWENRHVGENQGIEKSIIWIKCLVVFNHCVHVQDYCMILSDHARPMFGLFTDVSAPASSDDTNTYQHFSSSSNDLAFCQKENQSHYHPLPQRHCPYCHLQWNWSSSNSPRSTSFGGSHNLNLEVADSLVLFDLLLLPVTSCSQDIMFSRISKAFSAFMLAWIHSESNWEPNSWSTVSSLNSLHPDDRTPKALEIRFLHELWLEARLILLTISTQTWGYYISSRWCIWKNHHS
jgi:hypothetical protein